MAVVQGMRRLKDDGLEKVKQGRTSMAEVASVVMQPIKARLIFRQLVPIRERTPVAIEYSEILLEVVKRHASDLHLTAGVPPTVRQRGRLVRMEEWPRLTPEDTREFIYSILTTEQRRRLENDLQLDFAYVVPGQARFRVNAYFQRTAVAAAFRLIPSEIVPIDRPRPARRRHELARRPRGLVLVTGPTGSGKSTTLASMIDEINKHPRRAHRHDRGPDRVRARPPALHDQPARAGDRRHQLRGGAQAALRQDPT